MRVVLAMLGALLMAVSAALATETTPAEQRPPPQRIVSLLPSLTETVCALGACERLVGIDRHSNWPQAVNALPRLGGLEDLQLERIVRLKPDLVLAAGSTRGLERLRALGVPVVTLEPRNLADTRRVITSVAALLGLAESRGVLMWEQLEQRLVQSAAKVPAAWRGRSVYFEIAATPYAASEASFIGELLARLGLVNVVAGSLGPFPQLSPEWVVKRQPQVILGSAAAVREMPRRPGFGVLVALQSGRFCGFEAATMDTLVRPGPRLADAAEALLDCLQRLPPPVPA